MPRLSRAGETEEIQMQMKMRLKYNPARIFTYLGLVGITSAFLFLSVSYFATTIGTHFNNFKLPLLFHANTIIILVSSYCIAQTRKAMLRDDWNGYLNGLLVTGGFGRGVSDFSDNRLEGTYCRWHPVIE